MRTEWPSLKIMSTRALADVYLDEKRLIETVHYC